MLAIVDGELDNGPRTKSATMRMCAVSREVKPVDELIRFVLSPQGEVVPDLKRKLPGRGLWITHARYVTPGGDLIQGRGLTPDTAVDEPDVDFGEPRPAKDAILEAAIEKSKKATDINEPNLANCQQCHAPSKSRSDCGTCHVYHPPSVAKLLRTR